MTSTENAVRGDRERAGGLRWRRSLVAMFAAVLIAVAWLPGPAFAAEPRLTLSLVANTNQFYAGQGIALRGALRTSAGDPVAGHTVYVQVRTGANKDQWKTIATTTSKSSGRYSVHVRNNSGFTFRTYAKSYGEFKFTASDVIASAKLVTGAQSFDLRATSLEYWLRAPLEPIRTGQVNGQTARWRQYEGGTLVQHRGAVYFLFGSLNGAYLKAGGPAGKLGAPVSDADCHLIEGGCIQSFTGGAIYYNPKSVSSGTTHVVYGSGVAPRLIAVASSQVGYREPGWMTNKYTAWNGRKAAWCGVFQSWVSAAGKNGQAVPQVETFPALVTEVKRRGITSKPTVGSLVFIDFAGGSNVTHTGLVTKVYADGSVDTIEGNTVTGTSDVRVVARKHRSAAQSVYFYVPGT